ncbi:MAG: bifunctional alpha/beta hydrolase/class I SAM-dependent methyltransferase [Planctomycetaceae bacterium]
MTTAVARAADRNTTAASRPCELRTLALSDGTELFYRVWPPRGESDRALVLFHRGHEHSGRWQDFVDRVDLADHWIFAWDARGHGHTPGERGYAPSLARMIKDADEFVRAVCDERGIPLANLSVVAQSVGAVLAAAWVHDYAPPIRSLVLATPAFRVKLYVPLAIPGLRILRKLKEKSFIKSYVKPRMLTHDAEQARQYAADPLISPQISVNILLDLFGTSARLVEDAGAIAVPTLMLVSGTDFVVRKGPQLRFFERLSSPVKECEVYPGFFHSTFFEKDRDQPIARAREFILRMESDGGANAVAKGRETGECREAAANREVDPSDESSRVLPTADCRLHADRHGHSKDVFDRLRKPLPITSPRRWWFALHKPALKFGGLLSEGIRTGWRTGFDSGESLDHVYRDTAQGRTPLGRLIDRIYLDAPGWRGIRQRKVHVQALLDRAIAEVAAARRPVHLLDIAAGPGRYVLDTLRRHAGLDIAAVCCDRDEGGLAAGRRLAEEMQVTNVEYRPSDAFDPRAITAITPRPNIAIVSGLYELFPENDPIRASLGGLSAAVEPGGWLVYTNQPWHPQQEMIARVLPNRDGEPWVMRCRSQAEMDALIAEAGFEKVEMLIDEAGIFTASLARRVERS